MTFVGGRFFVRIQVEDPERRPRLRVWELIVPALNSTAAPLEALSFLMVHDHISDEAFIAKVVFVEERPSLITK